MDRFQTRRFLSSWQLVTVFVLAVALGTVTNEQGVATAAAAGGQYTIPTGDVTVVWPTGWVVVSQNDDGIELVNVDQFMQHLSVQAVPLNGTTMEALGASLMQQHLDDQGATDTSIGPVTTDSGFMFITDDEIGPRMGVGFASSDPTIAVVTSEFNIAPGSDLTVLATDAHGVMIDGIPALQGIEAIIPPANATEAGTPPATAAGAGGQYTIPTGNVDVVWPAGWTVYAQTEEAITLTNAAQTMLLQIMAIQNTGGTWDQIATNTVSFMTSGQGANGTISGPIVTDSGFWFTSDGDDGPLMAQGFAAADPAVYIRINTGNIAPGSDLTALATEAHGVTVNSVPALLGIEAVIPPAA